MKNKAYLVGGGRTSFAHKIIYLLLVLTILGSGIFVSRVWADELASQVPFETVQTKPAKGITEYTIDADKLVFFLNLEWSKVKFAPSETSTAGAQAEFRLKDHEGNFLGPIATISSKGNDKTRVKIEVDKSHFAGDIQKISSWEIVPTKIPNGYYTKIHGTFQKIIYAGCYVDGKREYIQVERTWLEGEKPPTNTKLQLYDGDNVIMWDRSGSLTTADKNWQITYPPEKASQDLYFPLYKPDGSKNENLRIKDIQTYPRNGYKAIYGSWENGWQVRSEYDGLSKSGTPQAPKTVKVSVNWLGLQAGVTLPDLRPVLLRAGQALSLEPQKVQAGPPLDLYEFSDLLIYNPAGEEFEYRLQDLDLGDDWFTGLSADGLGLTIIHKDSNIPGKKQVRVNWLDREGKAFTEGAKLPARSDLILTGKIDGEVVITRREAVTAPQESPYQAWAYTFVYLPDEIDGKTISYEISQGLPDGYVETRMEEIEQGEGGLGNSVLSFTNHYNAHRNQATGEDEEKKTIHVTKIWYGLENLNHGEDAIGTPVKLKLYQNDQAYKSEGGGEFVRDFIDPYEKNSSQPWHRKTISFTIGYGLGFEVFDTDGKRFKYSAREEEVPKGYTVEYLNIYAEDRVTVSNTYDGSPREIRVTKRWETNHNKLLSQPERPAVTLVLKRDNTEIDRWQVPRGADDDQLIHVFEKQKAYAPDGTAYEYTIIEENLPEGCIGTKVEAFTLVDSAGKPTNREFTLTNRIEKAPDQPIIIDGQVTSPLANPSSVKSSQAPKPYALSPSYKRVPATGESSLRTKLISMSLLLLAFNLLMVRKFRA